MVTETMERKTPVVTEVAAQPAAAALPWLTVEKALYAGMFILALSLRLLRLGEAPLDSHEAAQALAAYRLATGAGLPAEFYSPLLFTFNFITSALIGSGDALTRLLPVLAGSAMVITPYWLRRWLGRPGALATAALFVADPAYLFFSRQLDEAIVTAAATLALLTISLRFLLTPIPRRLMWLAVWLAVALVSGPGAWLFSLVALAFVALVVFSGRDSVTREEMLAAGRAIRDDRRSTLTALLIGAGVFLALSTAVFFNPTGIQAVLDNAASWFRATADSLGWGHYPAVALVYGTLVVALAFIGGVWFLRQRNLFVLFLLIWFGVQVVVMELASARLAPGIVTVMLPLILIAGMALGSFLDVVRREGRWAAEGLYLLVSIPFLVGPALQIASYVSLPTTQPDQTWRLVLIVGLFAVFIGFITWAFGAWQGRGAALRGLGLLGLILLGLWWVRTTALVNYPTTLMPQEFIGGPRSSEDVPRVANDVLALALDRFGARQSQPIALDHRLSPLFEWYLRWSAQLELRNNVIGSTAPQLLTYVPVEGQPPAAPAGYAGQAGRFRTEWTPAGLDGRGWLRWLIFREVPGKPPTIERFVWFSRPLRETAATP